MRTKLILLTFISISLTMCNLTFLNHKDYKFKVKDFVWNTKIEGLPGQVYVHDSKIISNKEFTILFSRGQFFSIQDITHFKEGKYILTYNGESGYDTIPYHIH